MKFECYDSHVSYDVDFSDPLVIAETSRVDAPTTQLFEILRDPKRHHEFDGSTMVRDSDAAPIEHVGDAFVMNMHNDDFGDYQMRSEVIEYVADRAIAWAPRRHDIEEDSWDHRWGWRLTPDGQSTQVTAFFDCRQVPDDGRRILRDGEWARPILARSLVRLEAIVTT